MSRKLIDLTGQRFGRWTVLHRTGNYGDYMLDGHTAPDWLCRCDCGTESVVTGNNLRMGKSTACVRCRSEAVSRAKRKRHADERKEKYLYG